MRYDPVQYGWRAKIGLITVASNWVMEAELSALAPEGVALHTAQVSLRGKVNEETLGRLGTQATDAAGILAEAPLDAIILGCTSGSFIKGLGYDHDLIRSMQEVSGGIPCTTTATAVLEALRALGARSVAVATPYVQAVNDRAIAFLEGNGFMATGVLGMGIEDDVLVNNLPQDGVFVHARKADSPQADVLLISCTSLRTLGILEALEQDLKKPVISSNQVSMWHALRVAGVSGKVEGCGRLMRL